MLLIRCIQLVRKMQYRSEKLDFFCNISSHTLGDDAFFGDFVAFLESNRDLSKHLIFEFSQNDYEAWDSGAALYLRRLADLGCRFSLDGVHHMDIDAAVPANRNRSDELRVGTECVSTCSSRWSPDHEHTN